MMLVASLYLDHQEIGLPSNFDFFSFICFGILGLILILRPIKDFRFGTFLSLAIGLIGAAVLVFLGANQIKIVAGVFVLLFLLIYGTIRMIEDLYLLIAEILSHPIISVTVGIICVIQGFLELIGLSLADLFAFIS
jgi:hypothetical protein